MQRKESGDIVLRITIEGMVEKWRKAIKKEKYGVNTKFLIFSIENFLTEYFVKKVSKIKSKQVNLVLKSKKFESILYGKKEFLKTIKK